MAQIQMTDQNGKPIQIPDGDYDVSSIKRKYPDVPYAENHASGQKMDIYLPETGNGPFPTIVFIHGGAFIGGDKRDFQLMYVMEGLNQGYAVVSLNHRFSNEATFPLPVYDVKAAVRFLRANAEAYQLDPTRFAAIGASSGAYFASMLAATADCPALEDKSMGNADTDASVQALVGLFGVYDLAAQSRFTAERNVRPGMPFMPNFADLFAGIPCADHPELTPLMQPDSYVTKACPPALIQAGTGDAIVPFENSIAFAAKINAVCGEGHAIYESFPGCGHGDRKFDAPENIQRIFRFLNETLK